MTAPGTLVLAALLLSSAQSPADAAALRARGVELSFNLDHADALIAFRDAIKADPDHLAGYRLLTAALWADALFKNGAITADDFTGETRTAFQSRRATSDLEHAAADLRRRVDALSNSRRGTSQADAETAYQIGAAYRLLSALAGSIRGSQFSSLGAARRAYQEHQRVLTVDRHHADARLTVGLYRYFISRMPAWSRLFAVVAGLDSDRDGGLRLVEQAAASDGPAQANALLTLIVIYNQQARYEDALAVIRRLQQKFPRNRLLWLEAATTQLRAGRAAEARESIEHGLRMLHDDPRPRAFGELGRWRYHYGVSLAALQQTPAAKEQFTAVLQGESLDWVRDNARLELARLSSGRK
ncbi:MAG TPA: tetratricopeptide repeat protein [Vicinamibacterales bacterium]|nr:tetratricopeptide repeat protein [Vicinamibacterales bacterium]